MSVDTVHIDVTYPVGYKQRLHGSRDRSQFWDWFGVVWLKTGQKPVKLVLSPRFHSAMVPILDPCNLLSTILIVILSRPDRRDLTGYLDGTIQKKDLKSIDQSAPLQGCLQSMTRLHQQFGVT